MLLCVLLCGPKIRNKDLVFLYSVYFCSHCLCFLFAWSVVLICSYHCPILFYNHLAEEEEAGCFVLIAILMSFDY